MASPDQIRVLDLNVPIQSQPPMLPSSRELGSLGEGREGSTVCAVWTAAVRRRR